MISCAKSTEYTVAESGYFSDNIEQGKVYSLCCICSIILHNFESEMEETCSGLYALVTDVYNDREDEIDRFKKIFCLWSIEYILAHNGTYARAVMHVEIANPRWRGNVPGILGTCATRNFNVSDKTNSTEIAINSNMFIQESCTMHLKDGENFVCAQCIKSCR